MADFLPLIQQHRNELIVERFELRVGVDIENFDRDAEFRCQGRQCKCHVVTEVAIAPRNQRQFPRLAHPIRLSSRATP